MNGAIAFLKGMGLKNVKPALYAWFFNFFFSIFIYFGFYHVFFIAAGKTKIAADPALEIGIFSFLSDLARNYNGSLVLMVSFALLCTILYFFVSIFVSAGIYSVLVGDERTTFSNLIASSVENLFNMIKVFLVNILNWLVTLFIPGILLFLFLNTESFIQNEAALKIFTYLETAITILIFIVSTSVYDLSRIFKLKEDRNVFYSFKRAILFTFSNKLNIAAIFLLYAVSLLLLFFIYAIFNHFVEDLIYVFFLFIIYQGFIFLRYFLKVVVMRAEIHIAETPS